MLNAKSLLLVGAVSLFAVAFNAHGQGCTTEAIACSGRKANRLENATCRFSNTQDPYFIYYFDAYAGQILDVFLSSGDFRPYVAIYFGDENTPRKYDDGLTIAGFKYDVPRTGRYWILAAASGSQTRGIFELSVYCSTICKAPFGTAATSVMTVPWGTRATIQTSADGTPPLTYRWYAAAQPSSTLATTTTPSFTTNTLFANTTIGVEVSNSCGKVALTAAIVNVEPCSPPAFTQHPVSRTVTSGMFTALQASASGTFPISYQWYRGTPPDTSRPAGLPGQSSFTLIATPALAGPYWVRATNGCGSADSNVGILTVEGGGKRRAARH